MVVTLSLSAKHNRRAAAFGNATSNARRTGTDATRGSDRKLRCQAAPPGDALAQDRFLVFAWRRRLAKSSDTGFSLLYSPRIDAGLIHAAPHHACTEVLTPILLFRS